MGFRGGIFRVQCGVCSMEWTRKGSSVGGGVGCWLSEVLGSARAGDWCGGEFRLNRLIGERDQCGGMLRRLGLVSV